jgi:hypothetical protein
MTFIGQRVGMKGVRRECIRRRWWIFNAPTSELKEGTEGRGAQMAEGRGVDEVYIFEEEGRGNDSMEGRRVGDAMARLRAL